MDNWSSQQPVDFIHEQLYVVCDFRPLLVRFDEYGFEILSLNRFIHLSVYVILMLDLAELFGKRADAISISISLPFTGRKNEKKNSS